MALNDRSNELKPPLEVEDNVVGIMKSLVDLRDDEDMGRANVKIWVRLRTISKTNIFEICEIRRYFAYFQSKAPAKTKKEVIQKLEDKAKEVT